MEQFITNKNIFLDLGTHNCQGLSHFVNTQFNMDDKWEIHTFEPNPLIDIDSCVKQFTNKNIKTHKKAVWISNGKTVFGQYGDGTSQGSLIEDTGGSKHYHDFFNKVEVETIDFFEFVNKFNQNDNIYIKMDIEWAEYNVLRYMLDNGWPTNIKEMWVEFHGQNDQEFIDKSETLIKQIQSKNTIIHRWI